MEPRFDRSIFRNEYPKAWHENSILSVNNAGDLSKTVNTIQRFFEKFVIRGQVLLDQAEQDPTDHDRTETFCRYFEVYLQDVDCYAHDPRVAQLRDAYMRIKEH